METIKINTEFIKLDQLLKFSNITENGADAKYLVVNGYVKLNGETELRRGKKIYDGDVVEIDYEDSHFVLKVEKDGNTYYYLKSQSDVELGAESLINVDTNSNKYYFVRFVIVENGIGKIAGYGAKLFIK